MTAVKSLTLYIDRKPYFPEPPPTATKFPPPWLPCTRGMAHLQNQQGQRNKVDKGAVLPKGWSAPGRLHCLRAASNAVAAASPSCGGTSPSSFITPLHHPHCNLLANMMFDVIYYFP
jgi:hypothetical protein